MSAEIKYQSILVAICSTPPFKKLVATIRSEDHEEPVNESGATRRAIAVKYLKREFGRILTDVLETEKIMRGTP